MVGIGMTSNGVTSVFMGGSPFAITGLDGTPAETIVRPNNGDAADWICHGDSATRMTNYYIDGADPCDLAPAATPPPAEYYCTCVGTSLREDSCRGTDVATCTGVYCPPEAKECQGQRFCNCVVDEQDLDGDGTITESEEFRYIVIAILAVLGIGGLCTIKGWISNCFCKKE